MELMNCMLVRQNLERRVNRSMLLPGYITEEGGGCLRNRVLPLINHSAKFEANGITICAAGTSSEAAPSLPGVPSPSSIVPLMNAPSPAA